MALILIVEKDEQEQEFLSQLLSKNGHRVRHVASGFQALLALDQELPDLMLLDKNVEDVRGESICWQIRKDFPNLPVIMLFDSVEVDKVMRLFRSGADDFIAKPLDTEALLSRIQMNLSTQREVESRLEADDLELDLETLTVKRGGREIDLTPREFELLKFLIRNKDQVLSREVILERVWSYDADVQSRAVDVYIGYLRKKIDQDFDKKLIRTVRCFGYTLKE